jgi:hypothetical protein
MNSWTLRLVSALLYALCLSGPVTGAEKSTVKLGVVGPFTGPFAVMGEQWRGRCLWRRLAASRPHVAMGYAAVRSGCKFAPAALKASADQRDSPLRSPGGTGRLQSAY